VLGAADLAVPIEHPVLVALLGAAVGALLGAGGLGLVVHATSASGRFNTTRIWLALRGSTPLRLMSFLADAHRLGVLRLAGPYYQFRHELLRDRLALRR
jgi:ABC-type proline/glycine betaine transport system permease subunit